MPFLPPASRAVGRSSPILRLCGIAALGAALLAASARLEIPFWPVPMTMQTFVVLMLGATAGPEGGVAAVFAYLLAGFVGLPVFAGGGGPLYFVGPTAGYLVGFLPAAAIVGFGARRGAMRSLPGALLVMLGADAVLFACGLAWLSVLIGPRAALTHGLLPFLPAEAVKIALATALSRVMTKRAG